MSQRNDLRITIDQYGACWIWSINKRIGHKPLASSDRDGTYAAHATASKAFQDALRVLTDITSEESATKAQVPLRP